MRFGSEIQDWVNTNKFVLIPQYVWEDYCAGNEVQFNALLDGDDRGVDRAISASSPTNNFLKTSIYSRNSNFGSQTLSSGNDGERASPIQLAYIGDVISHDGYVIMQGDNDVHIEAGNGFGFGSDSDSDDETATAASTPRSFSSPSVSISPTSGSEPISSGRSLNNTREMFFAVDDTGQCRYVIKQQRHGPGRECENVSFIDCSLPVLPFANNDPELFAGCLKTQLMGALLGCQARTVVLYTSSNANKTTAQKLWTAEPFIPNLLMLADCDKACNTVRNVLPSKYQQGIENSSSISHGDQVSLQKFLEDHYDFQQCYLLAFLCMVSNVRDQNEKNFFLQADQNLRHVLVDMETDAGFFNVSSRRVDGESLVEHMEHIITSLLCGMLYRGMEDAYALATRNTVIAWLQTQSDSFYHAQGRNQMFDVLQQRLANVKVAVESSIYDLTPTRGCMPSFFSCIPCCRDSSTAGFTSFPLQVAQSLLAIVDQFERLLPGYIENLEQSLPPLLEEDVTRVSRVSSCLPFFHREDGPSAAGERLLPEESLATECNT